MFYPLIKDLSEEFCCIKLFADDAKLYLPIRNSQDEEILQGNIDNSEIRAEISIQKKVNTRGMVLKTHQLYTMKSDQERVSLEQVNSEKDLGVICIGYSIFCVGYGIYTRERSSRVFIS